jgi:hypothetical protein
MIVMAVLLLVIFPVQVKAFDLNYSGEKEFAVGLFYSTFQGPEGLLGVGEFKFNQSLQLNFYGEDDSGYIRGFITDNPELVNQVYVDMNLGPLKLQWDKYEEGFLRPSWFNLEQKLQGLRSSYTFANDEVSILGVSGKHHMREEEILITPQGVPYLKPDGTTEWRLRPSLQYGPVVAGSVQAWLNGERLKYGTDYYINSFGDLYLVSEITRNSHLYIRYLQEDDDYLVLGARYDHHFVLDDLGQQLDGGVVLMQVKDKGERQSLVGTELFFQPKPWWSMELNTGIIQNDVNWRMSNQFDWDGISVSADYQIVSNRFMDLMNNGRLGRHLNLSGLYEGGKMVVKHGQNYHWTLEGQPLERSADLEFIWIDPNWVPYVYYSVYDAESVLRQHAIGEIGYQVAMPNSLGVVTYLGGIEAKGTLDEWAPLKNAKPYLGVKYQKERNQSFGVRFYGEEGLNLSQAVLFGDWDQGLIQWKGQLKYKPTELYQIDNSLNWTEEKVNVNLKWVQSQNFKIESEYMSLVLNLDFSQLTQSDALLTANLLREKNQSGTTWTYKVGGERALGYHDMIGYADLSVSYLHEFKGKQNYLTGLRGVNKYVEYDVNYTLADERDVLVYPDSTEDRFHVRKHRVDFSLGTPAELRVSGGLEAFHKWDHYVREGTDTIEPIDLLGEKISGYVADLDLEYPVLSNVTLGIHYTGQYDSVGTQNELMVRTVYHF